MTHHPERTGWPARPAAAPRRLTCRRRRVRARLTGDIDRATSRHTSGIAEPLRGRLDSGCGRGRRRSRPTTTVAVAHRPVDRPVDRRGRTASRSCASLRASGDAVDSTAVGIHGEGPSEGAIRTGVRKTVVPPGHDPEAAFHDGRRDRNRDRWR